MRRPDYFVHQLPANSIYSMLRIDVFFSQNVDQAHPMRVSCRERMQILCDLDGVVECVI